MTMKTTSEDQYPEPHVEAEIGSGWWLVPAFVLGILIIANIIKWVFW